MASVSRSKEVLKEERDSVIDEFEIREDLKDPRYVDVAQEIFSFCIPSFAKAYGEAFVQNEISLDRLRGACLIVARDVLKKYQNELGVRPIRAETADIYGYRTTSITGYFGSLGTIEDTSHEVESYIEFELERKKKGKGLIENTVTMYRKGEGEKAVQRQAFKNVQYF